MIYRVPEVQCDVCFGRIHFEVGTTARDMRRSLRQDGWEMIEVDGKVTDVCKGCACIERMASVS